MESDKEELERYIQVREAIAELKVQHGNLETNQSTLKKDVDDRFDKTDKKIDERFDKLDEKLERILEVTSELKSDKQAIRGGWKAVTILGGVTATIYTAVLAFFEFWNK